MQELDDLEKQLMDSTLMGVATYMTAKDMSDELRKALTDIETLRKLSDSDNENGFGRLNKPKVMEYHVV